MSRLKVVLLALVAVFMMSAVATATAAAEELPEFTVETKLEASFGKSKLNVSGIEIKSTEGVANESTLINKHSGKVLIWFKKSTLAGGECHSAGDANENILVPVEWHVTPPFHHNGTALIVFLITETEIKCTAATVTVLKGSVVIGKISLTNTKTSNFTLEVNAPSEKQEITEYVNNNGEPVKAALKIKDGKKELTGSQEDEKATITTEKETELIEEP